MDILSSFSKLTYKDQVDLLDKLKREVSESKPILNHTEKIENCPHCGHNKFHKHGTYKSGGNRFKCVKCKKTFNDLTGTSIHCIKKKHLWSQFIDLMFESKSIRDISKELQLSTKTVFDWRHKVLSSFDELFKKEFKGVVEIDDIHWRFNQKGRKRESENRISIKRRKGTSDYHTTVLLTIDRYKTYDFKMVKVGSMKVTDMKRVVDSNKFNSENIICSDASLVIRKYFKGMNLPHYYFTARKGEHMYNETYHIQNLNNKVSFLKTWVKDNFSSVSTKYLRNYLNWFFLMEILKEGNDRSNTWWDYMLSDRESYKRFGVVEETYNELLQYSGLAA